MKRTCILPAAIGAMLVAAGTASAQNTVYWDINGATAGSGNAGGTWNSPSWSLDPTGASDTAAWVDGDSAVFSAGTDGTGTWHVTVSSAITTPSITWKDPFAASGNYHNIDGGPINIGGGALNSSALGFAPGNGNDVNINAVLAGAGGLTIAAHGDATSDTGGGGGAEFRLNNANNSFSGGLTITSGLVSWNVDAHLGDISNVITLNGGGILCTNPSHSTVRDIKVGAAGGTIRTYGSTTLKLTGTLANDAGVASTTLRRTDGGTLIITTQGTGFAGTFRIGGGDTQLAVANADWSNTDFVVVGGGSAKLTPNGGGTAVVNSIESYADVQINNGTTLDVDTGSITMGPTNSHWYKTNVGALGMLTSSSGTLTITNGLATGDLTTYDHQVRVQLTDSGATPVALVKNNNNSLVINQDNTYSGGTTINGGRVESNGVPGFGTGAVVVSSGGQAWVNANGTYPNDFTINGIGVTEGAGNLGAIRFSSLATIGGTLNVASDARITAYDANDRGTIAGPLTGTAALEKTGGGTITLGGDGSGFSGTLTVGAGTVVLGNALGGDAVVKDGAVIAGEGQVAGKLTLGEAGGADIKVDGTTAGALGTKDLTVNGLTYVRLSGAPTGAAMDVVTYTGTLALSGATLDDNFMLVDAGSYRGVPVFANTGSAITLTVPAGDSLVWRGDDATNPTLWDLVTTPNWTGVADPGVYYNGDSVLFDDTGVSKTVDLPEDVLISPATVVFNNSAGNDYNLVGDSNDGFTGPTSLVKNGAGTVTMSGYSHNYTGPVTINEGVLRAASYETLGYSLQVTVNNGGQLDVNGMSLGSGGRHHGLTIAGSGPDGLGAITNSTGGSPASNAGILNLTLTDNASVGGNGGRFDIGLSGGVVGFVAGNGFTLTKVGSGSVCMRAADTDVKFVIEGGTLKFEDYNTSTGPYAIDVNAGTLQSYGDRNLPNTINMASGTTLDNDGGGTQTWTGPVNLNVAGAISSNVFLSARSGRIDLPGVISGDSSVTVNGNNILALTGAASNTYTGATSITSTGQLVLAKTGGAVAIPGDLYLSSGGTRGIVSTAYDNQFGPDTVLRWASAGDTRLELKGTTQTVAGIDNTGYPSRTYHCIQHSEFGNPAAVDGVSDLVLNVAEGASFSYDGALRDQGGRVNVTKNGLGTQQLRNTLIDYTGSTVVNAGRLVVNSDDVHTTALVLATGAVFEVVSDGTYNNFEHQQACTISGTGTYLKSGANPMSVGWGNGATVAMSSGGLIHIAAGTMRLEYGVRTQWGPNKGDMLIDAGATFDLWDNHINDGTYPNPGVFVDALNGEGAITRTHGVTGNLTVGVDDGDGVFSGSISSAPGVTNLIKVGAGTQTLAGANSHTGNTTVNGGTLNLASTGSLAFTVTDVANNQLNGTGAVILDGSFVINTAVTATSGSWTLVDTASLNACTYGATFSPGAGWVEDADVWTLADGTRTWTFTEATGVLALESMSYAMWIDGFFPGETDPAIVGSDADPDNDSIPNSVEMVIGGDPKDGMDVALLPTIELVTDPAGLPAGNWVLFTYRRTDLAVAAGLGIAGEYGIDLVNWAEAQNGVNGVVILEDDDYASFDPPATAPTDRVRIYAPQVLQTLFGRLKVTVPVPVP